KASIDKDLFRVLLGVLTKLFCEVQDAVEGDESRPLCLQVTTETFRCLRNACVQCPPNQSALRELGFVSVGVGILSKLLEHHLDRWEHLCDARRCGIQFLGNLAAGNQACKDDIWEQSFPQLFLHLLQLGDEKAVGYGCMLLHSCLDQLKVEQMVGRDGQPAVARRVVVLCKTHPQLDWPILIVTEHLLRSPGFIQEIYSNSSDEERLTLLELVSAHLAEGQTDSEDCGIPPGAAEFLASCFHSSCKDVLLLHSDSCSDAALAVIRLLEILCEMTSDRKAFMFLQDYPDLLETAVALLKEVHLLGKEGGNVFTVAQDFSRVGPGPASSHPAVSFKAHLVRLVGNLCHGNSNNQNKLRELDGIPLILDNCSIDSNNPFISQWAVFAIRNILERNAENQSLVQALKRQGVADDSALREMGFQVEERDGSLLLRPLNKSPQP
uniref:Ataxin-10 n=1 Tax=Denticeps clupeoides TaxID=299321 RepID=A0AAY4BM82_9TELE